MSDTGGGNSGRMMTASSGNLPAEEGEDIDTDGESSGGFDQCQPLGESFLWLWDSMDFEGDENLWTGEVLVSGLCDLIFVDSDPLDPSTKGFGLACTVDGRMDGMDVAGIELLAEAERSGDPLTRVVALQALADVADREREPERAEAALTRAAEVAEKANLELLQAKVAFQHARLTGVRGADFERAQQLADEAIRLSNLHDPELAARATIRLGAILHHARDPEAGRDVAEAGMLELERRVAGDELALLRGYNALSSMEYDLGDVERARELSALAGELSSDVLGEMHDQTLTMLNNAAVL